MAGQKGRRGRGEGSIEELPSGKFRAILSDGTDQATGKRRWLKETFGTKREALAWMRERQTEQARGPLTHAGKTTVAEWLKQWLAAIKAEVANNTFGPYERDVNRYLMPRIGHVPLAKLTALGVQKLYAELAGDGISPSMIKKAGTTLGAALQRAALLGMIPANPARGVPKPRVQQEEMQVLDVEQAGQFLAAARADRLYALWALWLDSGAREGELFALHWPDVDLAGKAITIRRSLEEIKGKLALVDVKTRKSRRRVAMGDMAAAALAAHRAAAAEVGLFRVDGPVFTDTQGGLLRKSNVQRRHFQPILTRAKLPKIRPYDLRHTSATLLLAAGEEVKVVSERLGHSTTRLTMDTYMHVLKGMQERAASKIDALLRASEAEATAKGRSGSGPTAGA